MIPDVVAEEKGPPSEEPTPSSKTEAEETPSAEVPPSAGMEEAEAAPSVEEAPSAEVEEVSAAASEETAAPVEADVPDVPPAKEREEKAQEESEETGMRWYVIHTYSGYEGKVKASIEERKETPPLQGQVGNLLVPTEDVVEIKGGKRRVSARKYFPGYILIQMRMNTDTWYLIKNTPKVTGFLGGENLPTPLENAEVEKILERMQHDTTAKPKVLFERGESVRVVEGPFTNFTGMIEEVNLEKGKLKLMVTIFGRPTPVELEFLQVEKI
jgi:transcriptional antiterminator NusG